MRKEREILAYIDGIVMSKNIARSDVIDAIKKAVEAAIRRKYSDQNPYDLTVDFDEKTGHISASCQKEIVAGEVEFDGEEISLEKAREIDEESEVGGWILVDETPHDSGRILAQTALQYIRQNIARAEREVIYDKYKNRIGDFVIGTVKRQTKNGSLILSLDDKVEAILPRKFIPRSEEWAIGDKVKALLMEVGDTENGGAEVILTRTDVEFVKKLFFLEVPELKSGEIEIIRMCREPGYRTKMSVISHDIRIDPVGTIVGVKGDRINRVKSVLCDEKIDVFRHSDDPIELLQNSLMPIEIKHYSFHTNEEGEQELSIVVSDENNECAKVHGKRGWNAKLSSKLIGMKLHIQSDTEYGNSLKQTRAALVESEDSSLDELLSTHPRANPLVVACLNDTGITTIRQLLRTPDEELQLLLGESNLKPALDLIDDVLNSRM